MNELVKDLFQTEKSAVKVLVISDSHGDINNVLKTVEYHLAEIDLVLFLGDGAEDIAETADIFSDIPFYAVTGNNDYPLPKQNTVTFPLERLVNVLGINIYMTHGHLVSYSLVKSWVVKRAQELDADIALYGHLHIPDNRVVDNVTIMNPGSLSYPRGKSEASYLILDITREEFTSLFFSSENNKALSIVHK